MMLAEPLVVSLGFFCSFTIVSMKNISKFDSPSPFQAFTLGSYCMLLINNEDQIELLCSMLSVFMLWSLG